MEATDSCSTGQSGRIRDARGRIITQLDPIALIILRQHKVIDADCLRNIANEKGVRVKTVERIALVFGICGAAAVVGLFTFELITGGIRDGRLAKSASLFYLCILPWIMWFGIKRKRFVNVKSALLKYRRCPHCGYDLRGLPADPADTATICPECGCAWKLTESD